ncbi:MAG: GNAT family N-acetyltransferase [Alphaproteobacteria bacterium]|nr:GNAT family N-acetyltransferase [Alphaproteobacteria bacterium]
MAARPMSAADPLSPTPSLMRALEKMDNAPPFSADLPPITTSAPEPKVADLRPLFANDDRVCADIHKRADAAAAWPSYEMTSALAASGRAGWLAMVDGKPAGFLLYQDLGIEAEIIMLAVDPAYQRRGIARQMLKKLIDVLRARGFMQVLLEVAADNQAAIGLYQQFEFALFGQRLAYYRRGLKRIDALLWRLVLGETGTAR